MIEKIRVQFLPDNIAIETQSGISLLDAALEAGIFIPAACGGSGACGQCKVRVLQGEVSAESNEKIKPEERAQGFVLACKTKIVSDVTIEVPQAKVGRKVIPRDEAERMKSMALPMESPIIPDLSPMTIEAQLNPAPPKLEDNTSDYERIVRTLKVDHGISPVTASLEALKGIPNLVRDQDWHFSATLQPERLPEAPPVYRLLKVSATTNNSFRTALAVDIGTTSLWAELVNIDTGKVLARASRYNPQISMGDDVISRIVFSLKKDGLEKLQQAVVNGLNEIIDETLELSGTSRDQINYMVAAGNTVMTHLFLGLYPKYLRQTPYVPVAQNIDPAPAVSLGLDMPTGSFVCVVPGVASYVGGDIVSGVLANGMWDSDSMTLFIDIGTNGEIVAGNRDMLMTASCSAGPAFEGGGLRHGMRAAPGAIEGVLIDPETYEPMIKTIDAKPAIGICGSGIINIISQMLRNGILNQNAKFAQDLGTDRIRKGDSGFEYVVCRADQSGLKEDITLSEVDLDNIIRAKGAMFSGYTCLLEKIGLTVEELDRVIIAGAFGSFINLDHAVTIGLLPDIPREKFSFIGNSSLKGARLAVLDHKLMDKSKEVAKAMMNVELSEDPSYMDNFMAALFLPHTRMELFPSVKIGSKES